MIWACLVPVRRATGFGETDMVDETGSVCDSPTGSGSAPRRLVLVSATTGSMPIAASPASVAISVVPWPSPVSRQRGSPL